MAYKLESIHSDRILLEPHVCNMKVDFQILCQTLFLLSPRNILSRKETMLKCSIFIVC